MPEVIEKPQATGLESEFDDSSDWRPGNPPRDAGADGRVDPVLQDDEQRPDPQEALFGKKPTPPTPQQTGSKVSASMKALAEAVGWDEERVTSFADPDALAEALHEDVMRRRVAALERSGGRTAAEEAPPKADADDKPFEFKMPEGEEYEGPLVDQFKQYVAHSEKRMQGYQRRIDDLAGTLAREQQRQRGEPLLKQFETAISAKPEYKQHYGDGKLENQQGTARGKNIQALGKMVGTLRNVLGPQVEMSDLVARAHAALSGKQSAAAGSDNGLDQVGHVPARRTSVPQKAKPANSEAEYRAVVRDFFEKTSSNEVEKEGWLLE